MNIKTIIVSLLFVNFFIGISNAQAPKVTPVSPDAASLAKMVNYPVNLNTGVPSISIPLYQIESGGMVLPITLNYHAGGFKINEKSTNVGLGWSLSSDIQITRSINGIDDFIPGRGYIYNTNMKTHYSYPSTYCPSCPYPLQGAAGLWGLNEYSLASGELDGMPDKFNYKLLNKSGSFYFQKNNAGDGYSIVTVPLDNIKITYNSGQFIIVDTDGTEYAFGSQGAIDLASIASKAVELSGNLNSEGGTCFDCKVTTWKAKTISNSTWTDQIVFTYVRTPDQRYLSNAESIEYFSKSSPSTPKYFRSNQINASNPTIDTYTHLMSLYPFYSLSAPKYFENFADRQSIFHLPDLGSQNQVIDNTYLGGGSAGGSSSAVAGLTVSKIEFRGGSVNFSGTDQLQSITVKDHNANEVRTFSFFQSYQNASLITEAKNANGVNFKGTMYLDSIKIKQGADTYETYGLLYKDKFCFGEHLKGSDAWGYPNLSTNERYASQSIISVPHQMHLETFYYNNTGQSTSYVNNVEFHIGNLSNTEMPDRVAAQRGMLKRIIYPTGGYVDFDFESNMYKVDVPPPNTFMVSSEPTSLQSVKMGGGLRVKAINYYTGESKYPAQQKYYRYGDLEDGIGLLLNTPSKPYDAATGMYTAFSFNQTMVYLTGPSNPNLGDNFQPIDPGCNTKQCLYVNSQELKRTYMPASSNSYTYPGGAPIYYNKVTEYNLDMGVRTGKKVYTYYKPLEFHSRYSALGKIPGTNIEVINSDGLMGAQKMAAEYKYANGKYSLLHSKEFSYSLYVKPEEVKVVYAFFNVVFNVIGGTFSGNTRDLYNKSISFATSSNYGQEFVSGEYGIQVGKLLLSSETERWQEGSQILSKVTNYSYEKKPYLQVSKIEQVDSKGQTIVKSLKYAYDFVGQPIYDTMISKNMISQVVEETVQNSTINKEISKQKTNYISVNSGSIVPGNIQNSYGGNPLETQVSFDSYDDYGNILQVTENNALVKSYLWGYGQRYLVAEILGKPYATVASNINVATLQGLINDGQIRTAMSDLRTALPGAMITSFTHKVLIGASSKTIPNGMMSFYEYDSFGRLKIIKDQSQNIVKKYDYLMRNPIKAFTNDLYYVNIPIMGTFTKRYDDLSVRVVNQVEFGGEYFSNDSGTAKAMAENLSETHGEAAALGDPDGPPQEIVQIILGAFYESNKPSPGGVYADFILDGNVVASRKFPSSGETHKTFYIVKGEYQVSIRQDDNFSGSVLKCDLTLSTGVFGNFPFGSSVDFVPGTSYKFFVNNNAY